MLPSDIKQEIMRLCAESFKEGGMAMLDSLYEVGIIDEVVYNPLVLKVLEADVLSG